MLLKGGKKGENGGGEGDGSPPSNESPIADIFESKYPYTSTIVSIF